MHRPAVVIGARLCYRSPMPLDGFSRLLLVLAGLLGAGGVTAAAAAAHMGDTALLGPLSLVALTQAPAMLAFGLVPVRAAMLRVPALVIGAGALVFAADLAVRHFAGVSLFPYAAPIGGTAMIAGWLGVAVAALVIRRG